jgi:hypothetical protein
MQSRRPSQIVPFKLDFVGIGETIARGSMQVPRFQREYAWKEEHVTDLYSDLAAAIKDGADTYFLGSIVTVQHDTPDHEVIDGQQRLATIVILLAAIRDYFYEKGVERSVNYIDNNYLMVYGMRESDEGQQRLTLNQVDNEFFRKRVLSLPGSSERLMKSEKRSEKRLEKAAELAAARVKTIASETNEPVERLLAWVEYIHQHAKVIWLNVSDTANAFMIFETLNDRGLALAISDLLKNHLFSRAHNRMNEAEQHWNSVTSTLEASEDEKGLVDFIRSYWSSVHGLTRKESLFDAIKQDVATVQQAVALTKELSTNARLYIALESPDENYWDSFAAPLTNQKVRDCARTLNMLGSDRYRTLMLAVMRKLKPEEVVRCLEMQVNWIVRFTVCGTANGTQERMYPTVAAMVSHDEILTARDIYDKARDVIPNDHEFKTAFSTYAPSKMFARYLLRMIESDRHKEAEVSPNTDAQILNLEHILPDSPTNLAKSWKHFSPQTNPDIHKAYKNRLGNLTLLGSAKNRKAQDSSFDVKKKYYSDSNIVITKELSERFTQWTTDDIELRQLEFADRAPLIWPSQPR